MGPEETLGRRRWPQQRRRHGAVPLLGGYHSLEASLRYPTPTHPPLHLGEILGPAWGRWRRYGAFPFLKAPSLDHGGLLCWGVLVAAMVASSFCDIVAMSTFLVMSIWSEFLRVVRVSFVVLPWRQHVSCGSQCSLLAMSLPWYSLVPCLHPGS